MYCHKDVERYPKANNCHKCVLLFCMSFMAFLVIGSVWLKVIFICFYLLKNDKRNAVKYKIKGV